MHDSASVHDLASLPRDDRSRHRLAERGLRYDRVDTRDTSAFDAWIRANRRGFHAPAPQADQLPRLRRVYEGRRLTGVWDDDAVAAADAPAMPIATIGSWRTDLTMPGGAVEDLYAISSVTVSPTHAGLGIARDLVEGELRTASSAGFAIAGLTVTESGLYARYGFGPSAFAAHIEIDAARVRWRGPASTGRVVPVELAAAPDLFASLHDRARLRVPGEVTTGERFWERATGADTPDEAETRAHRFVAHRSGDGEIDGAALYRLDADPADFTKHTLVLEHLVAANDAAERDLWHYVLRVPLVTTVRAELRPVDDPVPWLLDDARAVSATRVDHHWLRILDVPRALTARTYAGEGRLGLIVHDELGFASGCFAVETNARGRARVERLDDAPITSPPAAHAHEASGASAVKHEPRLELDVATLASLLLGGVSASELDRAGRIIDSTAGAVAHTDALFRVARAPWLSTWY